MAFSYRTVVPWGRSFEEYMRMFALSEEDLGRRILGCGDGPAGRDTERGGRRGGRCTEEGLPCPRQPYTNVIYFFGPMGEWDGCTGFQWDEGNSEKNWIRHKVSRTECEQVFFNRPLLVAEDWQHSQEENRYYALGRTDAGRRLFIVYTLRGELIRVISARDMTRREGREFEHATQEETEADPET